MEELYQLLLGPRYVGIDKYPANVRKTIDLAIKAYLAMKKKDDETLAFVMAELGKFLTLAFKTPHKEQLLIDFDNILHAKSEEVSLKNFQLLLKDAIAAYKHL